MSALRSQIHVLFVCTGNICRSPTAHALFRAMVKQAGLDGIIHTDSAGTHGYHVGELPDPRAIDTALGHGIDMSDLRARKFTQTDFSRFDYIFAMDRGHYNLLLQSHTKVRNSGQLTLFLDFPNAPNLDGGSDMPDPYYGTVVDFEKVFKLVEQGCGRILREIRQRHTL